MVRLSAEASGRRTSLLGTASQSRFQMLRNPPYRYDYLVDYRNAEWMDKIIDTSSGGRDVQCAVDCISEGFGHGGSLDAFI